MLAMNSIGLLGNGGQANETESFFPDLKVEFRAVEVDYLGDGDNLIDISSPTEEQEQTPIFSAAGAPRLKKKLIDLWSGNNYAKLVSANADIGSRTEIGVGTLVASGSVLTTDIKVGEHVLINTGCTVGHDTIIGDYATLAPGVHIGGKATIGNGVFVGIGATIKNGVKIAPGAVIGAGAVVIEDIEEENSVYVGVPAKMVSKNDGWLDAI